MKGGGRRRAPRVEGLLRIGEVARRAGVPTATVKHYVREGLLPVAKKTFRNMAYYSPEAVERIRLVKELQEKRFLPLKVIKTVFGRRGPGAQAALARLRAALSEAAARVLAPGGAAGLARERAAAAAGVTQAELAALERADVIARRRPGEAYDALDARLLAIVGDLRRAGFTRRRGFGAEILTIYKRAADALAREEAALFLTKIAEKVAPEAAGPMLEAAIDRIGELFALLRRRALSREIAGIERATAGPWIMPRGPGRGRRGGRAKGRPAS